MSKREIQKAIKKNEGLILSEGTLRTDHLLATVYDFLEQSGVRTPLLKKIRSVLEFESDSAWYDVYYGRARILDREEAERLLNEDAFWFMNEIAPSGYYFGSHPGDGACIGFFRIDEEA